MRPLLRLALAILCSLLPVIAQGQEERLFLPLDAEAEADFERLDGLAKRQQWDRVVTELDRLFGAGGGKLIEREGGYVTVRDEARRRLLALPQPGRDAYALSHQDPARRLYERALEDPGVSLLEELVAGHPASDHVAKARDLLASRYFERGEPGAALLHLEALLATLPDVGEQARLLQLRVLCLAAMGRHGEAARAHRDLDLPAEVGAELLAQVNALRPPTPEAPPPAGAPLAWSRRVFGYYGDDRYQPPWSLPRADVAWLYAHDGSHAQALDLRTGKLTWRTPLTPTDAFLRPSGLCRLALAQRVVVCVLPGQQGGLVGLERQTGRVLWRRSLTELKRDAEIDFPAHLSGRPEVVGDVVAVSLVTDHQDHEVHTLAVDVHSGALEWHVFLASQNGGRPPLPYLTPGLQRLFVVTGLGAVAALDLSGEIQWLRTYTSARDKRGGQRPEGFGRLPPGFGGRPANGGPPERDPTAVVTRGVLWAAPADAKGFLAWDARTGEPRAKLDLPAEGRILGPRAPGVLVLSGDGDVFDVTRAGAQLVQQVGGTLIARPHLHGEHVFVPRSDGVVDVDLSAGKTRLFCNWEDAGGEGNLIVAGGRLVVASHRGLFGYGDPVEAPGAPDALGQLASLSYAQREAASGALQERGEAARAELEALASEHLDPEVRLRAAVVLGELDRQARLIRWTPLVKEAWKSEISDLLNRLTHPNPEVRLEALRKLGSIQDDDVVVLLHDLLADEDTRVAFTAAITLLPREDRSGLGLIAETLRDGLPADRMTAITVLGAAGSSDDLPLLTPALAADEGELRAAAAKAMLSLGKALALDAVLPLMDDADEQVRLAVLEGIRASGIDAKQAVGALAKAAQDENDLIREQAINALVDARLRHPDVFQALGMALGDDVQRIAKKAGNRLFKLARKTSDDVLLIPPEGIERGARLKDPILRGYAAQIAMLYAAEQQVRAREQAAAAEQHEVGAHHGARLLSVETLTRFMSDSNPRIRGLRVVGGPGWDGLLLERAKGQVLDPAEVAAIGSLALDEDYAVRHNGYVALREALDAPGRGRLLAGALADSDERIRAKAGEWLTPTPSGEPLDTAGMAKVLAIALRTAEGDPPGATEAQAVLDAFEPARALTLLVPVLRGWPDPAIRELAGARLAAATGGEVPYDPGLLSGKMADAYQVWAWRQNHPNRTPEDLLADLTSTNPSIRWKAAQAAAELPMPLIRNGVIASLGSETLDWVLKTKLEAAVAITGQRLGYDKRLKGQALRDCVTRFQTWLGRTLAAEATGGGPR
jgi:HEAT repeat protein